MPASWNICTELVDLTGRTTPELALREVGLISPGATLERIVEDAPWRRGGAETYVYLFSVVGSDGQTRRAVAKALVAATPGIPPEAQLDRWIHRRNLLRSRGCGVPVLYAFGKGMLVEEWIEHDAVDWLLSPTVANEAKADMVKQLVWYASCIDDLGFQPITFLPNIRVNGQDAKWIDFGSDLGGPYPTNELRGYTATLLARELSALGAQPWSAHAVSRTEEGRAN